MSYIMITSMCVYLMLLLLFCEIAIAIHSIQYNVLYTVYGNSNLAKYNYTKYVGYKCKHSIQDNIKP